MSSSVQPGRVMLVGAGPGPVDLMTVRALRAVQEAGALLYDALCSEEAVALAPPGCIRIQTGKRAGKPSMTRHLARLGSGEMSGAWMSSHPIR